MLSIEVHSHNEQALDAAISAQFGPAGGTIGRSPDCTLSLPDPSKIISRTHAIVVQRNGAYAIRDQGTTVPVIVNGRQVGRGREVRLAHGDSIRIAGYAMTVGVAAADTTDDSGQDADETTVIREGRTLLSWSEAGSRPGDARIGTVIVPEPSEEQAQLSPRRPTGMTAAPVAAALPAIPPVESAQVPVSHAAAPDELLAALLRGAGVESLAGSIELSPRQMEEIGAVMREMTRGLLDLLAARANAKREVHAEATMIGTADNNPLKFSPSLEAAIAQFLVPHGKGFMPPLRAVTDACESLRSHQAGFVAGMRAALEAVLGRFDPVKLERRMTEPSLADSLIPMNHKAKLWEMYEQLYAEIAHDAQGDFNVLFGEEFLRAYTEKARSLPPA